MNANEARNELLKFRRIPTLETFFDKCIMEAIEDESNIVQVLTPYATNNEMKNLIRGFLLDRGFNNIKIERVCVSEEDWRSPSPAIYNLKVEFSF